MPKSKTRPKSAKSIIAAARRPERVVPICLRADLIADIAELETQLTAINDELDYDKRLGDDPTANTIAAAISTLEEEAEEFTLQLRLRALPRSQWMSAMALHPPTPEGKDDGWLADPDKLARYVLLRPFDTDSEDPVIDPTIIDSDLDLASATDLLDSLTYYQWGTLRSTVQQLNGGDNSVPFSRIGWQARQRSDDKLKPPGPSASPGAGSTGGNPDESSPSQRATSTDTRLGD